SNINVDLIKPNLVHVALLRSPDSMLGAGQAAQDCSTGGETFDCPSTDPRCNTGNDPAPYAYTVRASEGNGLPVTGSCPPDRPAPGPNNLVFTWVVQGAGTVQFGAVSSNNAVVCRFLNEPIVIPCLQCTKTCLPGDCTDNGDGTGTIRFSGSVTNCS